MQHDDMPLNNKEPRLSSYNPANQTGCEYLNEKLEKTLDMPEEFLFEKRSLPELLDLYLNNIGRKKRRHCDSISQKFNKEE